MDTQDLLTTALGSAAGVLAAGIVLGLLGFTSMEEIADAVRTEVRGSDNSTRYV